MADAISLEPGDYWKLMKLESDLALAQLKAAQIVGPAMKARNEHLKALAAKHPEFKADDAHYTAHDDTCTLTVGPNRAGGSVSG